MGPAMNHKTSGIHRKRVSEAVFPADILAACDLGMCTLRTFGAWMKTLLVLMRENKSSKTATREQWGRFLGCPPREFDAIVDELRDLTPCDVRERNGKITLKSRRLARKENARKQGARRAQRFRDNAKVHAADSAPSSSSSPSTSSRGGGRPLSVMDMKDKMKAKRELLETHEYGSPPYKKLCKEIKELRRAIAEYGDA